LFLPNLYCCCCLFLCNGNEKKKSERRYFSCGGCGTEQRHQKDLYALGPLRKRAFCVRVYECVF
jgi:hypothetical protein